MALLEIKTKKIIHNIKQLNDYFEKQEKSWTLIIKILSGHKKTIKKIILDPEVKRVGSVGDSQLSSLRLIKKQAPWLRRVYIKPPVLSTALRVVRNADVSHNTSLKTLRALNRAAKELNKTHDVILMIELGEIREGILPEDLEEFYESARRLKNINVIGLGVNFGCMFGIKYTYLKLNDLIQCKHRLEKKFDITLPFLSGGTTLTLPLTGEKLSKEINHFRVGEAVFMGISDNLTDKITGTKTDVFSFYGNIIEMIKKNNFPSGQKNSTLPIGDVSKNSFHSKESTKAIFDFGMLDLSVSTIEPFDVNMKFVGSTSDMTIFSLGNDSKTLKKYSVGKRVSFKLTYMAVATLMYSPYITKRVIE